MKEVDDTPVNESESESLVDLFYHRETLLRELIRELESESEETLTRICRIIERLERRVVELEKELALLLEQRETVRAPEATDDSEWF